MALTMLLLLLLLLLVVVVVLLLLLLSMCCGMRGMRRERVGWRERAGEKRIRNAKKRCTIPSFRAIARASPEHRLQLRDAPVERRLLCLRLRAPLVVADPRFRPLLILLLLRLRLLRLRRCRRRQSAGVRVALCPRASAMLVSKQSVISITKIESGRSNMLSVAGVPQVLLSRSQQAATAACYVDARHQPWILLATMNFNLNLCCSQLFLRGSRPGSQDRGEAGSSRSISLIGSFRMLGRA